MRGQSHCCICLFTSYGVSGKVPRQGIPHACRRGGHGQPLSFRSEIDDAVSLRDSRRGALRPTDVYKRHLRDASDNSDLERFGSSAIHRRLGIMAVLKGNRVPRGEYLLCTTDCCTLSFVSGNVQKSLITHETLWNTLLLQHWGFCSG